MGTEMLRWSINKGNIPELAYYERQFFRSLCNAQIPRLGKSTYLSDEWFRNEYTIDFSCR